MDIQYKPSKPKKEKPVKVPKAPKADKPVKMGTAKKVKTSKPAKAPKQPKPEKANAVTVGKPTKVQTDKPFKVEKAKKPGAFSKVDPRFLLGGALVLIVAIAVIVLTVVLPAIDEQGMQIQAIEITRQPDKLVYLVGEEADYEGMRVTVTRNNGETFVVRASDCEITGFNSDVATEGRVIAVQYAGCTDYFTVTIKENVKPQPVLQSIRLEPMPKTEYKVGEWLNTDGAYIIREYVDGSTSSINLLKTDVYGWDKVNGPGTYELTVAYEENGVLCTYTYTITVTE